MTISRLAQLTAVAVASALVITACAPPGEVDSTKKSQSVKSGPAQPSILSTMPPAATTTATTTATATATATATSSATGSKATPTAAVPISASQTSVPVAAVPAAEPEAEADVN